MTLPVAEKDAGLDARVWSQILARYRNPSARRGIVEILITAVPLVALWVAMWLALGVSYWLSLALAVPAAMFLVRLFMIQHDCSHGSFFGQRWANEWVGRVCGVFTLTPFDLWRRSHAIHHATSGNLERRGIGDIETMTVGEYLSQPWWERLRYRLYRNPIVLFVIGPAYVFLIANRLPIGMTHLGWRPWLSSMVNNAVLAVVITFMMWLIGVGPFLMVHLPVILLASSMGVWLFFVQHQFDETVWADGEDWNLQHAALKGSSHYDLPAVLRWFTANIGVHHVHHLSSRIPYYRLGRVLKDHPELRDVGRLTLWQSFACVRLALWDERAKRMVSFGELRRA
ncbi:MAG: fatty acid desaturase [Alphaproteobacteria bacterium]|nr:fatty acid desaturase [Alphaproteobacteria bacterium]